MKDIAKEKKVLKTKIFSMAEKEFVDSEFERLIDLK